MQQISDSPKEKMLNLIKTRLDRFFMAQARERHKIMIALSKGGAMMNARHIDLTRPATWEFSGFSQNGEDGILDVLRRQLLNGNRYFIEIGSADGLENNSAWLVVAERYSGIMVEGDPKLAATATRAVIPYSIGAECRNMFVTRESAAELKALAFHHDPDVFSLDIDGNDYYIAEALFAAGFRPKIFVVEYNSVFGAHRSVTVEYKPDFVFSKAHHSQLYYGVSIMGWRNFFARQGYRFVTTDVNGVNGFFVDPACFDATFLNQVQGQAFASNCYQHRKFRMSDEQQFAMIADQKFVTI